MFITMHYYLCWVLILILVTVKSIECNNDRPIIGVLVQEIASDDPFKDLNYTSYLPAAYVKAVGASGARVVPVFIRRDAYYYTDLAMKLNGFLFTGGNSDLVTKYGVARSGKLILDAVLELNRKGHHIPILGVCQGLELLAILSNGWNPILKRCNDYNVALSIKLLPDYINSSLYQGASEDVLYTLTHLPSTANHHGFCLTQKNLTRFNLTQWKVLSTSVDDKGLVFVSTMEWDSVPIAAVQFHPEKLSYEWNPKQANPHDAKSISAARLYYDWLVAQSRRSDHFFPSLIEEENLLIYNYNPAYTGKQGRYDEQSYYFKDPPGLLENDTSINIDPHSL